MAKNAIAAQQLQVAAACTLASGIYCK